MHKRLTLVYAGLLLLSLTLMGCSRRAPDSTQTPPINPYMVTFVTFVEAEGEEVVIELGIHNEESEVVPANDQFGGVWELVGPGDTPRSRGRIERLPALHPGLDNVEILLSNQIVLTPGTYRLTWGAPGYGSVVDRFEVLEQGDRLCIGDHQIHLSSFPPDLLTEALDE